MNKVTLTAAVCLTMLSTLAFGARCSPNKGDFQGSPEAVRVLKLNWDKLRALGLSKELQGARWADRCTSANKDSAVAGTCWRFSDYGVGSFDPVNSAYCKNNPYLIVLHKDKSNIYQLYRNTTLMQPELLVAEFDGAGNQVAIAVVATRPRGSRDGFLYTTSHRELLPYAEKFGWDKPAEQLSVRCNLEGEHTPGTRPRHESTFQPSSSHFCRDYAGNDGHMWRIVYPRPNGANNQLDFNERIYRLDGDRRVLMVEFNGQHKILVDNTGISSPAGQTSVAGGVSPTRNVEDPAVANPADAAAATVNNVAKEIEKGLGGLLKLGR